MLSLCLRSGFPVDLAILLGPGFMPIAFIINCNYFFPNSDFKIMLPSLRSNPTFEVGIPVSRANFCLACVIPNARFHENERPGMPALDFLAIVLDI